ncbi:cell envelope protein [Methylobacterium sp. Leaf122]|nr:cell envelope protein [Methylobacterium sp. Leaf122]
MDVTRRIFATGAAAMPFLGASMPYARAQSTAQIAQSKAEWPDLEEAKNIAEEGFIYGLPLVMIYAVMQEFAVDKNSGQFKAPFNEIRNMHHVATPEDTAVITPNSDTPYSMIWLDLRAEPMVISVPTVQRDRYYAVQLIDCNTYNYGYIGTRATGTEPGDYLVIGPGWRDETPTGIKKVFRSTTPFSLALVRTQLFNPDDMSKVEKVQAGYKAQPLSAFLKRPAPPAAPKIDFFPATTAGIKDNFFQYLDAALQYVPETPRDKAIRARLAKIGIGPGKTFAFKDLSLEHKAAILAAMKQGDDKVDSWLARGNKNINGWNVGAFFGDEAFYNGDWVMRAGSAKGGLLGNDAVEAMYPYTRTDVTGEPLDGSKHKYRITFSPGQLPPVNAFWSVTMYDGKSQLLVKNPIHRYLINSPMLPGMKKDADGSLTLYLQKDSPGLDKEANWLPAPDDKIYLVMRLYWPKTTPPSILPASEGTWQPPGVKRVS